MRRVVTRSPSFPATLPDTPIVPVPGLLWQVLCGDTGHWRCGIYSPQWVGLDQVHECEQHDCPELFVLLSGRVTLVIAGPDGLTPLPLEAGRPVLIRSPHSGFCPDGPGTGTALVIERDAFETEYRSPADWKE